MRYIKVKLPDGYDNYPDMVTGMFDDDTTRTMEVFKPTYTSVHSDGFVGLVDFMGEDESIPEAARTSYAKGTKKVSSDRGLIRYLTRKWHTSPIEMVELKFHIKCPIFVARQWLRHRTASVNEQSARYSELPETFYIPEFTHMAPQSQSNKQGREGEFTDHEKQAIVNAMEEINQSSYETYEYLLAKSGLPREILAKTAFLKNQVLEDLKTKQEVQGIEITQADIDEQLATIPYETLGEDFPGLARELARVVIPVSVFTEFYWKINLHNLFHFLRLRMDSHAQKEIQDYANVIAEHVKEIVPDSWEAFVDYRQKARSLSRMELEAVSAIISGIDRDSIIKLLTEKGCSKREVNEFIKEVIELEGE